MALFLPRYGLTHRPYRFALNPYWVQLGLRGVFAVVNGVPAFVKQGNIITTATSLTGGTINATPRFGQNLSFSGSGKGVFPSNALPTVTEPFSVMVVANITSFANYTGLIAHQDGTISNGWEVRCSDVTAQTPSLIRLIDSSNYRISNSTISLSLGLNTVIATASSYLGETPNYYVNGVYDAAGSNTGPGNGYITASSSSVVVGGRSDDGVVMLTGGVQLAALFRERISSHLAAELYANPLDVLAPQRSVAYFLGTAGEATTTVTPTVGSIVVAGLAPTLITNTIQQPSAGSVIVTGNAPTVVENLILEPSAGTVVVSGFAPTLQIGADTTVQPGVGSVVVAGLAPTLLERYIAQPAAGSVVVSGLAPSLKFEQRFNPETGTVVVSGLAPTVVQNIIAQPGAGTIVVEGLAPNAGTGAFTTPGAGAIVVAGLAPTVTATAHVTVQPDAGQIVVSGLTPTVIDSGLLSAEQLAQLYGGNIFTGKKKKKKKKPELEEMVFEVAKTTAGKKEIIHVLPKAMQEELPDPQLALVSDLVQKIEAASAKVKKEVERIHKKRRDDDEDDIFILLM